MLLAHKLSIASPRITAEAVEANEFPDLANRYEVYGVPRTIINESFAIEGAVPEPQFVEAVLQVMDETLPDV